jgi:hypothetical protein
MNEIFTKSFWKGVKKTFDDAREGRTTEENTAETPPKPDSQKPSAAPEAPPPSPE